MSTAISRALSLIGILAVIGIAALALFPVRVSAVGNAADLKCNPAWDYSCPCGQVCKKGGPPGGLGCPCGETTNGFSTTGVCKAALQCLAQSTSGQNGGMGEIGQALQAISQLLQQMMQGGGGGGSSGGSTGGVSETGSALGGCSTYYNVTTPSSDPCAVYVPPVSDSLGSTTGSSAASDLISSLLNGSYGSSNVPATSANTNTTNTTQTNTTQTTTQTQTTASSTANPAIVQALVPGVSGDIQYSSNSVTVLVNNVDTSAGTQVAGFYGTNANGQPTSVISGMCQGRPWATNFLSFIIPASFFDSLCELRGYKVGTPQAAAPATHATVTSTVTKATSAAPVTPVPVATSTGPYVEPQADIWAVPASVPLGARTTVFWTAKGVTECTESSPDGSFSENSLSGGAATVPLSGATTYTISCLTPAGDHITNYVTVNLSAN